jgi:hypothetical protein
MRRRKLHISISCTLPIVSLRCFKGRVWEGRKEQDECCRWEMHARIWSDDLKSWIRRPRQNCEDNINWGITVGLDSTGSRSNTGKGFCKHSNGALSSVQVQSSLAGWRTTNFVRKRQLTLQARTVSYWFGWLVGWALFQATAAHLPRLYYRVR